VGLQAESLFKKPGASLSNPTQIGTMMVGIFVLLLQN